MTLSGGFDDEFFREDQMPSGGLTIRGVSDASVTLTIFDSASSRPMLSIPFVVLDSSQPGWGSGLHPTTNLMLQYLLKLSTSPRKFSRVVDYGCGSGILTLAAHKLLRSKTLIGVDIEEDALLATSNNCNLNTPNPPTPELFHAREIIPSFTLTNADLVMANILIGPLVRPSMISVLVCALREPTADGEGDGGMIVFSGLRPTLGEVESLKEAYGSYLSFDDNDYAELSGNEVHGSVSSYGFDVGGWCRVVGRRKVKRVQSRELSELALQ